MVFLNSINSFYSASDDFNNGVVLTRRPLRPNELFQVRLERVVTKWAGSIEVGVTTHSAEELDFPFTMTNVRLVFSFHFKFDSFFTLVRVHLIFKCETL